MTQEETSMEKGIKEARKLLEQRKFGEALKKEPCLVCYSDIVFSPGAAESLKNSRDDLAVTYYTGFWELWEKRMKDPLSDLETFRLCRDKEHLLEIGRRPSSRQEIEGQYMGLIRFTPKSWEQVQNTISHPLEKPLEKLDMTTLLNAMLKDGCAIGAVPVQDLWLECDTQEDIEVYERFYMNVLK